MKVSETHTSGKSTFATNELICTVFQIWNSVNARLWSYLSSRCNPRLDVTYNERGLLWSANIFPSYKG